MTGTRSRSGCLRHRACIKYRRLFSLVDYVELSELVQSLFGEFEAQTRLLGAGERNRWAKIQMLVDPDRTGLHARCKIMSRRPVVRPDRTAQSHWGGIGTSESIFGIVKADYRQNRAELFFVHQSGTVLYVTDDRGTYKIAGPVLNAAACDNRTFAARILDKAFYLFILRLVLKGANLRTLF